jgi:hypothetical protein
VDVKPQVDALRDEWDRLRFGQLIETCRSLTTSLVSFILGMSLSVVTILGFAVDRKSWGLSAVGLISEAIVLVVIMRFRRSVASLMDVAATLETSRCQEPSVTKAHRGLLAPRVTTARLDWLVIAVAVIHIVVTILLWKVFNWSFTGMAEPES